MSIQIQVLVIGAGISGLTTAYALQKAGVATFVVDSAARPGGVMQTIKRDGYLVECGPQSFSGGAEISSLCKNLGLQSEQVFANSKAPRYILIDGALKAMPVGPALLASSFMGGGTRSAIVRDVLGNSQPPEPDESVTAFVHRKFSDTLLDRLAGPFVSGIYAGDPAKLSVRAAFPTLHEAEKTSGSVIRGMLKLRKKKRTKEEADGKVEPTLQTFRDGNETIIRALAEDLGDRLLCRVEVTSLSALDPGPEPLAPRFRVGLRTPKGLEVIEAERLVIAVPANAAGRLLEAVDSEFEAPLAGVEYAGVAVVSLGYRQEQIRNSLAGFGFLVPRSAGSAVLGTVWNSSVFPGRAPEGHALLTSFVGGATNPGAVRKSAEELAALAHREIAPILGIREEPAFTNVTIWPRAIPQYNLGHTARIVAIETTRAKFPGLFIAGNYLTGPAVGVCVERAMNIANEIRVSFAN
jgi:protoporphyrinogen/coproporphyrinogen III oxidase